MALRLLFPRPAGPPVFVLDLRVSSAWLLTNQATQYTDAVMQRMPTTAVAVPHVWPLALAEVVRAAEKLGRVTSQAVDRFLAIFTSFRIWLDDETGDRAWGDILALARLHNMPVSDAAYLELARRLGLPLAVLDPKLRRAAAAAGVPVFVP